MKRPVASKVLTIVNAPYRGSVDARQLANQISDPRSATRADAAAFAFFSEVAPDLQRDFIDEMKVDLETVIQVARLFAAKAGIPLSLAN